MHMADRRDAGWLQALGAGVLAGAVAAFAMTLVMVILRYAIGVATPTDSRTPGAFDPVAPGHAEGGRS
jgi:hypothetical protein